jgi:peroxiredoxin
VAADDGFRTKKWAKCGSGGAGGAVQILDYQQSRQYRDFGVSFPQKFEGVTMTRLVFWTISTVAAWTFVSFAAAADRLAEVERLIAEYAAKEESYFSIPIPDEPTPAQQIRRYEAWPGWTYLPKFLALAEAKPDDEAAFRSCQWIFERTWNVGNDDSQIFDADQKAWQIFAAHHTGRKELLSLCLRAVSYRGPAQEKFLRDLVARQDLPRQAKAFATVALAELLAQKHGAVEYLGVKSKQPPGEFAQYIERRKSTQWGQDLTPANAGQFKAESIRLLRTAIDQFADVPITISEPYFRNFKTIGDKARTSLHALQHLTLGSQAPNIAGKDLSGEPLDLSDHRGNVVLLTFWSTGCGPCLAMIPEEKKLLKTFQGQRLTLLSVCRDEDAEIARATVKEHGIQWPSWFDGADGPIARNYNILGLPTTFLLDQRGRIVAKDLDGVELETKIVGLLERKQ